MADQLGSLTQDLAVQEATLDVARQNQTQANDEYQSDRLNFDPAKSADAEVGKLQVFNQKPPQEHFEKIMAQAPLLMGLAAIGGSFGRSHGLNMIQSTNAMMKGLVQGSDEAYADARKKYDQQFAEYKDQQKTWFDVYKAYQSAYKGRIDVDEKAITAANQAVGIAQTGTKMTRQQIMMLPEIAAKIEKTHADISHMSAQEMLAWARLNEKTQTDQAKQTDKTTRTTAKDAKKGEELTALNADIDRAIEMAQNNAMVTGAGGMVRRVGEVAGNVTGISSDTTAHDFESMISAIELKAAHAVSGDNRTAKDQREKIDKIVRGLKLGATKENTISSLKQLKEIISSGGPAPQAALPTYTPEEAAKLPKGTKFTGTDGQTYTARGPQ